MTGVPKEEDIMVVTVWVLLFFLLFTRIGKNVTIAALVVAVQF
jgi:hypothetical protein